MSPPNEDRPGDDSTTEATSKPTARTEVHSTLAGDHQEWLKAYPDWEHHARAQVNDYLDAFFGSEHYDNSFVVISLSWNPFLDGNKIKWHDRVEAPFVWPDEREELITAVLEYAPEADISICPYLMRTEKRHRGNSVARMCAHSDVDDGFDERQQERVRELPGGCAVNSGQPGHAHVYARVNESLTPDEHTHLCRVLGNWFDAKDSKIADNDLMRMPGTFNFKPRAYDPHAQPLPVTWAVLPPQQRVTPARLCQYLGTTKAGSSGTHRRSGGNGSAFDAETEPVDLDKRKYSKVRKALAGVSGDRSDDTMRVVGACFDSFLTLPQTRWVINQRKDLRGRLQERNDDDLARCWDKVSDNRAGGQQQADGQDDVEEECRDEQPPEFGSIDGAALLDELCAWFKRYVVVVAQDDLDLLALWVAHTYLCQELYTTPRLLIDSIAPGSGKTTLMEHLEHLCLDAMLAVDMSSAALIPRMLGTQLRTILLDEIQRTLNEDTPDGKAVFAVVNSGYRVGAKRPVLVPQGRDWVAKELPTFAPLAMAGNSPHLPQDTVDRSIRILLMPDVDGVAEDSDWEVLTAEVEDLGRRVSRWADSVRAEVVNTPGELPDGCVGRLREKWRPLMRVAALADADIGEAWKEVVRKMAKSDVVDTQEQRDAGLRQQTPGLVLLQDLAQVWPQDEGFVASKTLVELLVEHNPDYWGPSINPGGFARKKLNETPLGPHGQTGD